MGIHMRPGFGPRHRTTVNVPVRLLDEVAHELGTLTATDTINRALEELLHRLRVERFFDSDWGPTSAELDDLRRPRSAEEPAGDPDEGTGPTAANG